jgi:hypothetical protein
MLSVPDRTRRRGNREPVVPQELHDLPTHLELGEEARSRLPPPYASINPARSAPLLTIQTVPAVDYAALLHHAI